MHYKIFLLFSGFSVAGGSCLYSSENDNKNQSDVGAIHQLSKINKNVEEPDEIFAVDYNLRFDDEKTKKILEQRLLEKAKAWLLLSISDSDQRFNYAGMKVKWPFFIDGIQHFMNRDLFNEYVRNNNRVAYDLFFKKPVIKSHKKSSSEEKTFLNELRGGDINDFHKDKMLIRYLVSGIFNKKIIENIDNEHADLMGFNGLEDFISKKQEELIDRISNPFAENPEIVIKNDEFKISDIWGDPIKFIEWSKISYNRNNLHQYHIVHKEKKDDENDEAYKNRLLFWEEIYFQSISNATVHFSDRMDSLIEKLYNKIFPSFLKDKEFVCNLLPEYKKLVERIQDPKGYDVDKFSNIKNLRKQIAESFVDHDRVYLQKLLARELETGKTTAIEQKKKDLEFLTIIQINYMLENIHPDDVQDILTLFRKTIPDWIQSNCTDEFDKKITLKTKNSLSYLFQNSVIKRPLRRDMSWSDVLEADAGPGNIYDILVPQDSLKDNFMKPRSRVFKDIAFGMEVNEVLSANAVKSKSIRIQNNYNKDTLEKELEYSDLYASTELFGDETIIKMRFGWGLNEEEGSILLKKQLVSISFIPATVKQLKESDSQLMDGMFGDAGEIEGKAKMAQNLQQYGFTDVAQYYQKQSNEKLATLLSNRQQSENLQKSHLTTMAKWIKGLESGENPYRFVKGVDLTSDFQDLIGLQNKISYYTNNPAIKIKNDEFYLSSDVDQNNPDINIVKVSNEGLCFYPARKIDQTPRLMFIIGLLASWHKHETERYDENLNINKNKDDF